MNLIFSLRFILLIICILSSSNYYKSIDSMKSLINFVNILTNELILLMNVNYMWRKTVIPDTNSIYLICFRGRRQVGCLTAVLLIANFILWLINQVDGKESSYI